MFGREDAVYIVVYLVFIGIRTLFDRVTRGYGDHCPPKVVEAEGRSDVRRKRSVRWCT